MNSLVKKFYCQCVIYTNRTGSTDPNGQWIWMFVVLSMLFLSSCRLYRDSGPMEGAYYLNTEKDLRSVGRVVLIELTNESRYPQISTDVTEALYLAAQKKQLFGLTVVTQDDTEWRGLHSELNLTPSLNQLSVIRDTLKCDAVMVGTITGYQPYPRMTIGIRLKLLDLSDGNILWALEQVWDSADRSTEARIKNYFQSEMRSGFAPLQEELVTMSSLKFIKFVAYEIAETLNPRWQVNKSRNFRNYY
jgi:hypothetical protein